MILLPSVKRVLTFCRILQDTRAHNERQGVAGMLVARGYADPDPASREPVFRPPPDDKIGNRRRHFRLAPDRRTPCRFSPRLANRPPPRRPAVTRGLRPAPALSRVRRPASPPATCRAISPFCRPTSRVISFGSAS